MEEMSPAVALPFRIGNSICDNSMEITRLKLITETASLMSDPIAADSPEEGCARSSLPAREDAESVAMEEVGNGDDVEVRSIPGSDEEDSLSVGLPEQSIERSCSVLSDNSSIASATEDFSHMDVAYVMGTSSSVDAVKSIGDSVEIIGEPTLGEPEVKMVSEVVVDSNLKVHSIAGQMSLGNQTSGSSGRSLFSTDYVPLWGYESICGRRPEMEDAVVAVPQFFEIPIRMLTGDCVVDGLNTSLSRLPAHFFGVYDGHGGSQVANYCRDRLHSALIEEINNLNEGFGGTAGDDLQRQWERVFTNCFLKVDAEVGGRVSRNIMECAGDVSEEVSGSCSGGTSEPVAPETVGSTAVAAVICSSHIIIANCGDSRAVLYRGKQPIPLSVDHKPNREDEYARIEAAGGKVIQWNGHRVFGVLAMSRSIGDRYLKPWIIPEPEVTLVPRMKEDECLVLASDGLWDVMSNEEVCEVARRRILIWHKKNGVTSSTQRGGGSDPAAEAAAYYLSRLALQKGSKDNITVIVVDLKAQRKFKSKT